MKIIYENDYGERVQIALPLTWHLAKNFTLQELANNKADETVKYISTRRTRTFLKLVQEFRDWYGKPINVTSNYRAKAYNARIGGDPRSLHLDGLALDFKANHNEQTRQAVRAKWREICVAHGEIGGINFYTNGYHIDIGESKYGYTTFVTRDYRGKKGDW